MIDIKRAALVMGAAGWYVFPVKPNKAPWIANWPRRAAQEARAIRRLFAPFYTGGVAIATGQSSLFILDVDRKHGVDGLASLTELERCYEPLPATRIATTPTGGLHYYFHGTGRSTVGSLGVGLDTRSMGGYVVAPPSQGYVWQTELEPVAAPAWLLGLAAASPAPRTPVACATAVAPSEPAAGVISEGQRNQALFRTARGLVNNPGMSPALLRYRLRQINAKRCQPPLDDAEIILIVEQAWRYATGEAVRLG